MVRRLTHAQVKDGHIVFLNMWWTDSPILQHVGSWIYNKSEQGYKYTCLCSLFQNEKPRIYIFETGQGQSVSRSKTDTPSNVWTAGAVIFARVLDLQ